MATEYAVKASAGFAPSLVKNLRYPFTSTERRIHTLAVQELSEAEKTISKYIGPTHPIRKELNRVIEGLRGKL